MLKIILRTNYIGRSLKPAVPKLEHTFAPEILSKEPCFTFQVVLRTGCDNSGCCRSKGRIVIEITERNFLNSRDSQGDRILGWDLFRSKTVSMTKNVYHNYVLVPASQSMPKSSWEGWEFLRSCSPNKMHLELYWEVFEACLNKMMPESESGTLKHHCHLHVYGVPEVEIVNEVKSLPLSMFLPRLDENGSLIDSVKAAAKPVSEVSTKATASNFLKSCTEPWYNPMKLKIILRTSYRGSRLKSEYSKEDNIKLPDSIAQQPCFLMQVVKANGYHPQGCCKKAGSAAIEITARHLIEYHNGTWDLFYSGRTYNKKGKKTFHNFMLLPTHSSLRSWDGWNFVDECSADELLFTLGLEWHKLESLIQQEPMGPEQHVHMKVFMPEIKVCMRKALTSITNTKAASRG